VCDDVGLFDCVAEGAVKKRVEDVMPIATGHEREELEAELQVLILFYLVNWKEINEDLDIAK
jgi:hypothetical protein